jgi:hypothetical protein
MQRRKRGGRCRPRSPAWRRALAEAITLAFMQNRARTSVRVRGRQPSRPARLARRRRMPRGSRHQRSSRSATGVRECERPAEYL